MSKQKAKGTAFESMVTEYLSRILDAPEIERRTVGGTKDRGDIAGVFFRGQRVGIIPAYAGNRRYVRES